jgi:hypothetical protein
MCDGQQRVSSATFFSPENRCTGAQVVHPAGDLWFDLWMARAPLREVRWLTLEELSEPWALELHLRQDLVLRELRIGIINVPRIQRGEGLIPELPPEGDLPSPLEMVDRDWVERFAAKNHWPRPRFWFGDAPAGRPVGRPQFIGWDAVTQEMGRRIEEGTDADSWRQESNHLSQWAIENFPRDNPPSAKTIRNQLGELRRALLQARN